MKGLLFLVCCMGVLPHVSFAEPRVMDFFVEQNVGETWPVGECPFENFDGFELEEV